MTILFSRQDTPTVFLAYARGGITGGIRRTRVWVNRQGLEEAITAPPRAYSYPRLSPDGTQMLFEGQYFGVGAAVGRTTSLQTASAS